MHIITLSHSFSDRNMSTVIVLFVHAKGRRKVTHNVESSILLHLMFCEKGLSLQERQLQSLSLL